MGWLKSYGDYPDEGFPYVELILNPGETTDWPSVEEILRLFVTSSGALEEVRERLRSLA